MKQAFKILCLFVFCSVCFGRPADEQAGQTSFRGHKLFSVVAKDKSQLELLHQLEMNDVELDFWSEPSLGKRTDFRVKPAALNRVKSILKRANMDWTILNEDIQESIDRERLLNQASRSGSRSFLQSYLSYDKILAVLQNLEQEYPGTIQVTSYGKSFEGNDLLQVKVSKDNQPRPAIWVESLTHAREWVTGSVSLNIIEQLANGTDSRAKIMLDNFNWYFTPVHNPDGYIYTWNSDRLWRKNRNSNSFCTGVDLNRNWDVHWREAGTSTFPCQETYGGPQAFSEPETQSLRDAVANTPNVVAFISFHSYSQLLLLPYAHGVGAPENFEMLRDMAIIAIREQPKVGGLEYEIGVPKDILYPASGGAYDYMMMKQNIAYAFTYEVRPDRNSADGFMLPANQIKPTCDETFASISKFSDQIFSDLNNTL